jgi:hypothetical protein
MTQNTVELDIFSGRPNPAWRLSEAEGVRLITMLKALPVMSPKVLPEVLGYRGFIVCMATPTAPRHTCVRIYGGTVSPHDSAGEAWRADPDRRIEYFLLKTAKPWIEESLYTIVAQAMQSHKQ